MERSSRHRTTHAQGARFVAFNGAGGQPPAALAIALTIVTPPSFVPNRLVVTAKRRPRTP